MKNVKGILLMTALLSSVAALSACGSKEEVVPEGKTLLNFEYLQAGFGDAPYQALAEAFMAEHDDVLVKLRPNKDINTTTASRLETKNNMSDIYIVRDVLEIQRWAAKGWVHDLKDDVYSAKIDGEETLMDLMDEDALEYSKVNDHFYSVPEYYNIDGFVYDAALWEKNGWEVPTTTKELEELCKKIKATSTVAPIVYCGGPNSADGYLYFATDGWMTAFEGRTNLKKFYAFESPDVFKPENSRGKWHGLTNLKTFFYGDYVMARSQDKDFMTAQKNIIDGDAAMMLNGSWFINENKRMLALNPNANIKMFKVPEVSDSNNVKLRANGYATQTGKELIDCAVGASYFIPENAPHRDIAIEFLKFINKRSSSVLYTLNSNAVRPLDYNLDSTSPEYKDMTDFGKSVLDMVKNNELFLPFSKSPLMLEGHVGLYAKGRRESAIYQNMTPDEVLEDEYNYVLNNWDSWTKA